MENQVSKSKSDLDSLLKKAKESSRSPGVYLMKDDRGSVLYVGKAKNLRNRVVSYFQSSKNESPRIELLVAQIRDFEVLLTETEAEALILECTLIKKYKPKFNVRLRDDKTYPYIRIQVEEDFPRLEWTRKIRKDGALYFGPFPSAWAARQVLYLLNETLQLRDCSENTFRHRSRPCLLHQIGKCVAPCVGLIEPQAYKEKIEEAVSILRGKGERIVQALQKGMEEAASKEEFELAANYRDQLRNLELVTETQGVVEPGQTTNRDVFNVSRKGTNAHGAILCIRGGKMLAVKHYLLQNTDPALKDSELLFNFVAQHYASLEKDENKSIPIQAAQEVLVPSVPPDMELLEKALGVSFRIPESKEEERLVQVAKTNADHALETQEKKTAGHGIQVLEEIQKKLQMDRLPHRIECYDISNIQGTDAVASRVVFIEGAPDKNLYRRYKIRTVEGANDFAMMKEVLERRFLRKEEALPDLVVVDGGKGQLAQAVAILEELNVQGVDVVGLAKARTESDFKSQEIKSSSERIFIPNRKNPVQLRPNTGAFRLLTHIRDEAHRFALSYHRLLRGKKVKKAKS